MSVGLDFKPDSVDSNDYREFTFDVDDGNVDRSMNEHPDIAGLGIHPHPKKWVWHGEW